MPRLPSSFCRRRLRFSLIVCSLLSAIWSRADHFAGANITYECLGSNQYRIYLDLYLNCAGVAVTPHTLYFSNDCGVEFSIANLNPTSSTEVSPLCPSQLANSTCNGGTLPSFRKHRFQTTLFLSPCNKWEIEWYACCRNVTQNISLTPGTYVVATLNNLATPCDRSPVFVDSGVPYVCVNQPVSYNPGVSDPDGNTMVFSLISARFGSPVPTNVTYQGGFSAAAPIPGIWISPNTGQLFFTPTATGFYVVAYQVTTYNSGGVLIGSVMRDLMFAVITCDGIPPSTAGITQGTNGVPFSASQFIACTGSSFCVSMVFTDPIPSTVISVQSNATTVLPGSTFNVTGTNPATATVCWTGNSSILPLTVWFQASDNNCPIANTTSTFAQAISCAFLPIELLDLTARPNGSSVHIEWTTGSETNNRFFTVERSADGDAFTAIGNVLGAGHSLQPTHYSLVDNAPLPGLGYYRLRQTDYDGTTSLSSTITVDRSHFPRVAAITTDHRTWKISGVGEGAYWSLLDARGTLLSAGVLTSEMNVVTKTDDAPYMSVLLIREGSSSHVLRLPPIGTGEQTVVQASAR